MAAAVQVPDPNPQQNFAEARAAQHDWAARPTDARLRVLRAARHVLAVNCESLIDAFSRDLARTRADSYVVEILPLLAACRFLEREASTILRTRVLGRRGLPFWLAGVDSRVERAPFGVVLVIAPANYPLFLAGVQALQALASGNAVVWKPGRGGRDVALLFARLLTAAGLPAGLLRITEESIAACADAIAARPDKIFFTGSSEAGRQILHLAADTATPVVVELSGCDAVIVLPGGDPARVVDALAFGMRLNGSATCMAPRRLTLVGPGHEPLLAQLQQRFAAMDAVSIDPGTRRQLHNLLADATNRGATIIGDPQPSTIRPILVLNGRPEMQIAQADLFAPVLTVLHMPDLDATVAADKLCPFGLTAAIFGEPTASRALGNRLNVGTVLINDLIVPTADPRVPFGGRRRSGFGTTRGAEGLLEMTSAKVVTTRTGKSTRHFQPTTPAHERLFHAVVRMTHSATVRTRLDGLRRMIEAARDL